MPAKPELPDSSSQSAKPTVNPATKLTASFDPDSFFKTNTRELVWTAIRAEAWSEVDQEPLLEDFLTEMVLGAPDFGTSVARIISAKLASVTLNRVQLQGVFHEALAHTPTIAESIRDDLQAILDRDPVAKGFLTPFLYFKGFHALQTYRVAHWLYGRGRDLLAFHLQSRAAEVFGVDIHPHAKIGSGILMDHATGIVVGETSLIENNVSILHEVTLGGTGKETGDRHPKVREGVLLGAGAKLLGNIEIGRGAKVGAGSVVLDSVPDHCTVAGVPAKIVAKASTGVPALDMDQNFPHTFSSGGGI